MNIQKRLNKCFIYFNNLKFIDILTNNHSSRTVDFENVSKFFTDLNLSKEEFTDLSRGICGLSPFYSKTEFYYFGKKYSHLYKKV